MILILLLVLLPMFPRLVSTDSERLARILPSYSASVSWFRLSRQDILFRLASLAGLVAVLFWFPVLYWTTYEPCGDDRDGGVLFFGFLALPLAFVLGGIAYAQVWSRYRFVRSRFHLAFLSFSTLFYLAVVSPVLLLAARIAGGIGR